MVGNDVVDLCDPDADFASFSPRFDERVFAPSERRCIATSADPESCRWRMWSAKEAAYKAVRKTDPTVVFSPRRLEVRFTGTGSQDAEIRGESLGNSRIEVRFFFDASSVHAVALCPGWIDAKVVHGSVDQYDRLPAKASRTPVKCARISRA